MVMTVMTAVVKNKIAAWLISISCPVHGSFDASCVCQPKPASFSSTKVAALLNKGECLADQWSHNVLTSLIA